VHERRLAATSSRLRIKSPKESLVLAVACDGISVRGDILAVVAVAALYVIAILSIAYRRDR